MSARHGVDILEVDILLFDVGGCRYGADASLVVRVDRPNAATLELRALGTLTSGQRALVFLTEEGEARLRVDAVHEVRSVPVEDLRRMPRAAASPAALGLWLDGGRPVVLIDLRKTRSGLRSDTQRQ